MRSPSAHSSCLHSWRLRSKCLPSRFNDETTQKWTSGGIWPHDETVQDMPETIKSHETSERFFRAECSFWANLHHKRMKRRRSGRSHGRTLHQRERIDFSASFARYTIDSRQQIILDSICVFKWSLDVSSCFNTHACQECWRGRI